jgi:chromosome segregation ATPase
MNTSISSRHIGRKIWYATAITLSVLVLLLSAGGIVGNWIAKNAMSRAAVSLLELVDTSSGSLRQVFQEVDQSTGTVRQIAQEVSQISQQISQNVNDQGLIATLLPEDKKNQLASQLDTIQESLHSIHGAAAATLELYRAIDRIPFISLPRLSQVQIDKIDAAMIQNQADVEALRQIVQDYRSGAAGQISQVTQAADKVSAGMDELGSILKKLDTQLQALQNFASRMQTDIPGILTAMALLFSLFNAFVIYTQVEVIRLYVQRWQSLKALKVTEEPPTEGERAPAE